MASRDGLGSHRMHEDEVYSEERIQSRLTWYREHIDTYLNSPYRRDQEYGNYLRNYFEERDANPNRGYGEPMPYNIYFC